VRVKPRISFKLKAPVTFIRANIGSQDLCEYLRTQNKSRISYTICHCFAIVWSSWPAIGVRLTSTGCTISPWPVTNDHTIGWDKSNPAVRLVCRLYLVPCLHRQ